VKVLLLGSGGRESALAASLAVSAGVSELVAAPGNPGIARAAELVSDVDPASGDAVRQLARHIDAELIVIGPEAPLVAGVADALRADGRAVFGPDAAAARIEGSKSYAKQLMSAAGVPTARFGTFEDVDEATAFMDELGPPYVIKADGLAAGKGVTVTGDRVQAIDSLEDCLVRGRFGTAGASVVIEEFLDGPETSVIAFSDGKAVLACEPAQDYKRALDDDLGPNTGGMGSYSPVPVCPPGLLRRITDEVLEPMVAATAEAGAPFSGALYAGLALTSRGPRVIEFNARFGDPETQALLPRLRSDLGELCMACARGELAGMALEWNPEACVTVVAASDGYPGDHETGFVIEGIDDATALGVSVFHAGTAIRDGNLVTAGGRVLAVSALGASFASARSLAYDAMSKIDFTNMHIRSDIGARAEAAERSN
jgi:phosphoribosylamine---glycine ligase